MTLRQKRSELSERSSTRRSSSRSRGPRASSSAGTSRNRAARSSRRAGGVVYLDKFKRSVKDTTYKGDGTWCYSDLNLAVGCTESPAKCWEVCSTKVEKIDGKVGPPSDIATSCPAPFIKTLEPGKVKCDVGKLKAIDWQEETGQCRCHDRRIRGPAAARGLLRRVHERRPVRHGILLRVRERRGHAQAPLRQHPGGMLPRALARIKAQNGKMR